MQDILFQNDLLIENGDFVIGESNNQHIETILTANKGEFKKNPELGAGIVKMLNDDTVTDFLIEAKKNLEYDGMKVKDIAFTEQSTLNIDAKYQ